MISIRRCSGLGAAVALIALVSGCASSLEKAARTGNVRQVQELIRQGINVNRASFYGRETALITAARAGKFDVVKILLDAGADVQARDGLGRTALMAAAAKGRASIVKLLLARGSSAILSDRYGDTPLTLAAQSGSPETISILKEAQDQAQRSTVPTASWGTDQPTPAAPSAQAEKQSEVDSPSFSPLPEKPDDFAVVIGVEKYGLFASKALYAERDAQSASRYFRALGVPERHIMTLLGSRATRGLMQSRIEHWLAGNVAPDSRVYIYFSGHGAPDPTTNRAYLVPYDGDPNDLADTAYPVDRLYASLNRLSSKQVLVFLDACFSGEGGRSVLAQGARPLIAVVTGSPSGHVKALTAAGRGQITGDMPGKGHGLFTYYMLKGLDGSALNTAGQLTMKSLYDYLKPKVEDQARLTFRSQDPQLLPLGWDGDWVLR